MREPIFQTGNSFYFFYLFNLLVKHSVTLKSRRRTLCYILRLWRLIGTGVFGDLVPFTPRIKINRPVLRVALLPRSTATVPRVPSMSLSPLSPPLPESPPSSPFDYLDFSPLRPSYSPVSFPSTSGSGTVTTAFSCELETP